MALTGVLRPGFIQLRVLNMAEALDHYENILGLDLVSKEADGRVYLKGWDEFDRHSVVLREASSPGLDVMAFKVDNQQSLDTFAQRVRDFGLDLEEVPAGEQPGLGPRVGWMLPSGHRIELYVEIEASDKSPGVDNPEIYPSMPRGMGATRFDHALLYGPNIKEVLRFFQEVLDFALTEKVDRPDAPLAIWLSCSNKAHDIAFVDHAEPGKFHHAAFFLADWNEIGRAADIIAVNDVALDIGPTRHGITRGQTIYFFDPSGNRNEVYAGGYTYYPDNPVRCWDMDHVGKGIFYYERQLNDRFLTVVT